MNPLCRIDLLGTLCVHVADRPITRFRTHKTGALLAFLAYHRRHPHARERLIALFWPDASPKDGRQCLSQSLSSLRRQLEPPGVPTGSILLTDRFTVSLHASAVATDVEEFEEMLNIADAARDAGEKADRLQRALALYGGDLLPGHYEEWVLSEQRRLTERFFTAVQACAASLQACHALDKAVDMAHRAVCADPLREESHTQLIKLLVLSGQWSSALRQYDELERLLREEWGETPSEPLQKYKHQLKRQAAALLDTDFNLCGGPTGKSDFRNEERFPVKREDATKSVHPALVSDPPKEAASIFPYRLTRFYGRSHELARLRELLLEDRRRLVTLTGIGGSGKTRLAAELASCLYEAYEGEVWFVPLADLNHPGFVPNRILDTLGIKTPSDGDALALLMEYLSKRRGLLILDNFEHLIPATDVVQQLLQHASALQCLLTSRQTLGLTSEVEFPVSPLPLPGNHDGQDPVRRNDSVRLFVDRAQHVKPDFQITSGNVEAVAELCRRLEGIPLALELAAARSQLYTPSKMLDQLGRRFDLLQSRKRDRENRHRTLEASIDWSYQLLPPSLRSFFLGLSVFRGGFTVRAVETVLQNTGAMDDLETLRECSLLTVEEGEETRFRLLETLREYALDKLSEEECAGLRRRHAERFACMAEDAEAAWEGPRHDEFQWQLTTEQDNLREALGWAFHPGCSQTALRLASALCPYWLASGSLEAGRRCLRQALATVSEMEESVFHLKALNAAGHLAIWQGDYPEADAFLTEAERIGQRLNDPKGMAVTLCHRGLAAANRSRYEDAERLYEQALESFTFQSDLPGKALCLTRLGHIASQRGRYESGRDLCAAGLASYIELKNKRGEAAAFNILGNIAARQCYFEDAERYYSNALEIRRASGDQLGVSIVLQNRAIALHDQGDLAQAKELFEESLTLRRKIGDRGGIVNVALGYASLLKDMAQYPAAHRLFKEALTLQQELGHCGGLEGWAELLTEEGRHELAALLFAAEEAHRATIGEPLPPDEQPEHDYYIAQLRSALGHDAYEEKRQTGSTMDWNQAARLALNEL